MRPIQWRNDSAGSVEYLHAKQASKTLPSHTNVDSVPLTDSSANQFVGDQEGGMETARVWVMTF